MKITRIIKEINNWFFLRRTVKRNRNTEEWKKQKYELRTNWVGTIYTVINLPPEVGESLMGGEDLKRGFVIEECKKINSYLAAINLAEIIEWKFKKIGNSDNSYLVTYKPIFNEFTIWWILKWNIIIAILGYLQMEYDLYTKAKSLGLVVWEYLGPFITPLIDKL